MKIEDEKFDELIELHSQIKTEKIEKSLDVLEKYYHYPIAGTKKKDMQRFNLTIGEKEDNDDRRHLSSTAICTYAVSQYIDLWNEYKKKSKKEHFDNLDKYYEYMINELKICSDKTLKDSESLDEFSLLNVLSFLKGLQDKIEHRYSDENEYYKNIIRNMNIKLEKNYRKGKMLNSTELKPIIDRIVKRLNQECNAYENINTKDYKKVFQKIEIRLNRNYKKGQELKLKDYDDFNEKIVKILCREYEKRRKSRLRDQKKIINNIVNKLYNEFNKGKESMFEENTHPFIYYKLLHVIKDWKDHIEENFYDTLYKKGKYEMYRQMTLYEANDKSLFDVKRLIYSLLIVTHKDKYSNNLIRKYVMDIIFKEQYKTGLWPNGGVINTDFVFVNGELRGGKGKIITASPILSSVECLNDMFLHYDLAPDLREYQEKINLVYEWIRKRLRKDYRGKPEGWFLEYEGTHIPKSWVAGHTLIFLKKYCEMISDMIRDSTKEYLNVIEKDKITEDWNKLWDSYKIKVFLSNMISEPDNENAEKEYRSALIFGPPGTGKSSIAQALANEINWDYVKLIPGQFLDEGESNVIPKANAIFNRLMKLKKTVIFFDEVDQFVEQRTKGTTSSRWIVTTLLPLIQDLRKQKDIIFVMATNDIKKVDPAITRRGRFDFVLPMGTICWRDRLKLLKKELVESNIDVTANTKLKRILRDIYGKKGFLTDKKIDNLDKDDISAKLKNFLINTDFVPLLDIKDIVKIFSGEEWEEDKLFKIFFKNEYKAELTRYEDQRYEEDQKFNVLIENIQLPPRIRSKYNLNKELNDNLYRTNYM